MPIGDQREASSVKICTLTDGAKVVVPDSLDLITPYVLEEQGDWFEDEVKFLRHLLTSGQCVIDIGANYGVYAMSMAKAVGPSGRVLAFEPTSSTADYLARSIAENDFEHVTVIRRALSDQSGTAQLQTHENSELNALVDSKGSAVRSETVKVRTLDECYAKWDWGNIAFVKIDAEGAEKKIVEGGRRFFEEESPLVQYEVKAEESLQNDQVSDLVETFSVIGYSSYRLVPGIDLLVPFERNKQADEYLLNLFCCKADMAEGLASRQLLVTAAQLSENSRLDSIANEFGGDGGDVSGWEAMLFSTAYGKLLGDSWMNAAAGGSSDQVLQALSLFALSRDEATDTATRFAALERSLGIMQRVCQREPSGLRLATLARIAAAFGARLIAVQALNQLTMQIMEKKRLDTTEPFLAPSSRFDYLAPGEMFENWALAASLEELERLAAYSSFYYGASARNRLDAIVDLGFASDEMYRRLDLLKRKFGAE